MQVVADHQDRRSGLGPNLLNQAVEGRLAGLVKTRGRFVQHQKLRVAQKGAGQEDALLLSAREGGHLFGPLTCHADPG